MLERLALPDEALIACLGNAYGIQLRAVEFLPIGNDAASWVFRAAAQDGADYFLKAKKGRYYPPSLEVPRYLKDQGISEVVAPLANREGRLRARLGRFSLILYPFIEGSTGMQAGLSDAQWIEFGRVLRRIHSTVLPATLLHQMQKEDFQPKWSRAVREIQSSLETGGFEDLIQIELASFWKKRGSEIQKILERTEELGQALRQKPLAYVLCHSDIHTANLIVDPRGGLFIVDWDQPLLAPRERDLMFVTGSAGESAALRTREEKLFFSGYGQTKIDALALAYYRYEWVVQEIGDFGSRVFRAGDGGEETRIDALSGFKALFQPGDVVEAAYRAS